MASVSGNSLSASIQPFEFDSSLSVLSNSSNVPSKFNLTNQSTALTTDSIPIVDFSALIAGDPHQRSKAVDNLATSCREWGFFILENHGIPETLMDATFTAVKEFFSLPESDKIQYHAKTASDPINCGNLNVSNSSNQTFTLWREFLKLNVHPEFHSPNRPQMLREVVHEYTQRSRFMVRKLIEAISSAFELDEDYVDEVLKMDSSFQVFVANYYPRCPQPDQAMGIPPHSDPGLLTFLIHNGVAGLQIEHDGKWFNADSPTNSILVNVADQLEIWSNGRCKSVKHRVVVNEEKERISIIVLNGPSMDAVVGPAAPLLEKDGRAIYNSMKYVEYLESQVTKYRVDGKSLLKQQLI